MMKGMSEQDRPGLLYGALEQDASTSVGVTDLWPRIREAIGARQRRGKRRAVKWALVPVMGVMAIALVAVVVMAGPELGFRSIAIAGWSASPQVTDPALEAAAAECRVYDEHHAPVRIIDQRGNTAVVLVEGERSGGTCVFFQDPERDGTWVHKGGGGGRSENYDNFSQPPVQVKGTGSLRMVKELGTYVSNVQGRVSPEIKEVLVIPERKPAISATVQDGYFLAWWPEGRTRFPWRPDFNGMEDLIIRAYGEDGSLIAELDGIWFLGWEPWDGED